MYDDDDEDFFPDQSELRRKMEKETQNKFREAAYKGYDLIVSKGIDAVDYSDRENAILAIRRILGLMIEEEQFERCHFIQNFLSKELGVADPKPVFDFKREVA